MRSPGIPDKEWEEKLASLPEFNKADFKDVASVHPHIPVPINPAEYRLVPYNLTDMKKYIEARKDRPIQKIDTDDELPF